MGALTSVNNDAKEPFLFYQELPPVKILEATSIPATSSSMMRYFIGQIIQNINVPENTIKVEKVMFGPTITEEQKTLVQSTIVDYRDNVFKSGFPPDDPKISYNTQYESISGFAGGNRKTKRRRGNKKRRSQKKKRRSQRK